MASIGLYLKRLIYIISHMDSETLAG